MDYFSRRVWEKNKNKKERPYISHISPGAPLRPIGINFGLHARLVDIINCAKFYRNRLRGLDSMSGQCLTIPIGLRIAVNPFATRPVAATDFQTTAAYYTRRGDGLRAF